MTTSVAPRVSVVIPVYRARSVIGACLEALARQVNAPDFEVIAVVNGEDDGTVDWVRSEAPWVRLIVSPQRLFAGAARNLGAATARGEILAFLDADCVVELNWVAQIEAAHRLGLSALIGGVIENDGNSGPVSWAYYFASCANWAPLGGGEPGVVCDLAGCCLTVRRDAFEGAGRFAAMPANEDTELSWRLERSGHLPILFPSIRVRHRCDMGLSEMVRRRFRYGIGLARLRARNSGWGALHRGARALAAPLVPWILLARVGRRLWAAGRYRREFLRALPATLLVFGAWSAGEAWGYLRPEA